MVKIHENVPNDYRTGKEVAQQILSRGEMIDAHKDVCRKIADRYGTQHQTIKAIEEMAELQKELCKFVNDDNGDIDHIIEELADVIIMIDQMCCCFDTSGCDVYDAICKKLYRQLKRMEDESDD